jgi:hypothetical protein
MIQMTPKEKANKLVESFLSVKNIGNRCGHIILSVKGAKKMAHFVQNSHIRSLECITHGLNYSDYPSAFDLLEYEREVKNEIDLV